MFLLSAAITLGGLAGFTTPASADCYGAVNSCDDNGKCARDANNNNADVNACRNASECYGTVNYCPNANGNKCTGTVNVCGKHVAGFTCGFSSVTDPQNQGNQTGEVDSHFVVFSTNGSQAHGRIECRFQTGPSFTNTGTILQTVTSSEQQTYVDLTSTVSYPEPTGDVYICTTWWAGDSTTPADGSGDTKYLSDDTTGELHSDSEITGNETCALAISQEVDSGPLFDLTCGLIVGLPAPAGPTLYALLCA